MADSFAGLYPAVSLRRGFRDLRYSSTRKTFQTGRQTRRNLSSSLDFLGSSWDRRNDRDPLDKRAFLNIRYHCCMSSLEEVKKQCLKNMRKYCIAAMSTAGMSARAVISTYDHDVNIRGDRAEIRGRALIPAVNIAAVKY